ncbi:heparinase II/III domain-containing protein [Echinimonas agarilytica]|uniref:Heparinase II/III family protein n=1 Tax=Echinimonas agarilytica TaxID=1215918 RepID=A0AA41W8X6_9GAMM|nr:heparinase II/III family protein [Echinimonas agarilytica]MCM2680732.1 heparinase II/III family protein [Echinimonas agarilytica]
MKNGTHQFTAAQLERIRSKATDTIIKQLIQDNNVVLEHNVLVPPDGRATWNLYYFCPDHGVRLQWDRNKPSEHCCPVDNKAFTGEPYDGAWWRWLNGLNAKACKQLGLLWQITGDINYLSKVREILIQYAKYYPDYQEHGGIPYNGPGKANAQTLCEANCHLDFALGYDFVKQQLSRTEQSYIEQRLLREGADFLMAHRTPQLHNHEMKINATVGVIGLILEDIDYLDFALHTKYAMNYQLNHGVRADGFWFEGSVHYHYYALEALLAFEKLARGTEHSLAANANYRAMIGFPLKLILNTGDFPKLNDCIAGQEKLKHSQLFEFAYSEFGDDLYGSALVSIYQQADRNNIDALLYGVDELPALPPLQATSLHSAESGITIFNDDSSNNSLLLKHSPYGGEHDHYDRLGLIIIMEGHEVLPDLGTTGYGAELHYGYYKNTASHNTLAINQQNQPPINPKLIKYTNTDSFGWIDTVADWNEPEASVDSHTLVAWDSASYTSVKFRRSILWLGSAAIEINQIDNPHTQQLDLTWHVRGQLDSSSVELRDTTNPLKGPLARMHSCQTAEVSGNAQQFNYQTAASKTYRQTMFNQGADQLITGNAPDNPAVNDLQYVLVRSRSQALRNVVLHDFSEGYQLKEVKWDNNLLNLNLHHRGLINHIEIDFESSTVSFT